MLHLFKKDCWKKKKVHASLSHWKLHCTCTRFFFVLLQHLFCTFPKVNLNFPSGNMTKLSSLLIPTICSLAFASPVDKKPVLQDGKDDDTGRVGGFFLYRRWSDRIEYLLLKKTDEDNWSPPKGNSEEHEPEFVTAVRETGEETGLFLSKGDYETFELYRISFEYETEKGSHKAVNMWRAKLKNHEKPIRLSEEDEAYAWLEYDAAIRTITPPYQEGLRVANDIIHDYEFKKKSLFTFNFPIPVIEINAHH